MVRVICHKANHRRRRMVQCYSTGDGNMSFHKGTLAIELVHPSDHSSPQSKRQMDRFSRFAQLTAESAYTLQYGRPYPPELPLPMEDLDLPCNACCFGPIPLPSNRHHRSNGDCLEGKGGELSGLLCAILCATIVHSAHTYEPT